ncbi:hypothetical protein BC936DRAFT_147618 [Jimgerdemannia flammicorona]|uniref:SAM domain-containing protein n=1 Tax=Jimgerdemannia flammicorona TaxID=994334 RepID=A0A433D4V3_9FUNG|nr:hypothetical protein BC936DRAFT_147618 [Jimgerdemannia flammicorona]
MLASFRLQETQADTTDTTEIRADTTETGTATIENTPASPTVPMQDITRRTLDTAETSGGAPGTVKTRADAPEARIDTTETRGDALQTRIDSPADAREALANTTGTGTDTPETRIVPPSVQIQDPVRGTEFVDDALTLEMARNRSTDVRDDPFTLETAILNAEMTPEVTEKEDQLSGTRHNKSKGLCIPVRNLSVIISKVTSTASGSAGRPRNPLLPNLLQTKHVYRWSYDDVVAFLRANLETWELEDAQYQIFKKEKISGKSLLLLTKEDFLIPPFELPLGSALAIVLIVRDLKKVKGIDECGAGMGMLGWW